jgi:hypothetical protein
MNRYGVQLADIQRNGSERATRKQFGMKLQERPSSRVLHVRLSVRRVAAYSRIWLRNSRGRTCPTIDRGHKDAGPTDRERSGKPFHAIIVTTLRGTIAAGLFEMLIAA